MCDKTMETEILKLICSNQGAVDTKFLILNLGFGESTTEMLNNPEKFAFCHPYGQQKVVARTSLRLCRPKVCPGSCQSLHLCKNHLLNGVCQFSQTSRGCSYSHDLSSSYNQKILKQHELDSLSRAELCTLLLQNDNMLLPSICHDYNNGPGVYGKCLNPDGCKRLHICERYLHRDCNCPKTHSFNAQQPMMILLDNHVPDSLFPSLKSVYANRAALRFSDRKGEGGNKGNHQQQQLNSSVGECSGAADNTDSCFVEGLHQREWHRGRGRGGFRGNRGTRGIRGTRGNRGNWGNQGNRSQQQRPPSRSDIDTDGLDLYCDGGLACSNSDAIQRENLRGRGGNRGNKCNRQGLQQTRSTSDIFAAVNADADSDDGPNRRQVQRPVRDKTEICMYFIKGFCKHGDERCYKAHDKMPYRWEVNQDGIWTVMPDNEAIERDYCDPKNTYSNSTPYVHFDTMTQGQNKVRRLSTVNSLLQPDFIHTTEWLWYWEDEFGKWNMYASASGGHKPADMDSSKLEQKFLENDKDVVEFTAGAQSYSLSFQDMIQTNKRYSTKRVVKRRPRFVCAADVLAKRVRRPVGQSSFTALPDHWDKTKVPQTGFTKISLLRTSDEFKEIEALFCQTMRGYDVVKIERIQNKALWEIFQWQKNQMMNNNNKGQNVAEKKLFHGTNSEFVDAISRTNFDWRICGTHGTAYGKGSYFARDAKYSHNYTGDSDVKSMFVARVLVGDYTKGSSDYRRPPPKDGGDINFYDSCVDDILTPSIFVVFEKPQIYPEYLLQYKTTHPLVAVYGASSSQAAKPVVAPRPVIAPQPVVAPKPVTAPKPVYAPTPVAAPKPVIAPKPVAAPRVAPSIPAYQRSSALDQTYTSSYQPSTSAYPYPTRTTAASSSSTPGSKKQSDSCVIA